MINKKRLFLLSGLLLIFIFLLTGAGRIGVQLPEVTEIVILHTNDEHGRIENFGKISHIRRELEKEYDQVLLVSAGDFFAGNPVVDEYIIEGKDLRGKPIIDIMSKAGYQYITAGNHEFDYGQQRLQAGLNEADFTMLAANIDVDQKKADMKQPPAYKIIETADGIRIALLGLTQVTEDGYPSTLPANLDGLGFVDPLETAAKYSWLADKSNVFVILSHTGYGEEREIAVRQKEVDIIIGGHSHKVLDRGEWINETLLTQAGSKTEYLGKITLKFYRRELIEREAELIELRKVTATDPEVEKVITAYRADMEEQLSRVITELKRPLRGREELGTLMAAAVVDSTQLSNRGYEVELAFQNTGGVRKETLGPGPVTVRDIYQLEPFGNRIAIFKMKVEQIKDLIFHSYQRREEIDLIPAGLGYEIITNYRGEVKDIRLFTTDGRRIRDKGLYTVAVNEYIASTYRFEYEEKVGTTSFRHNELIINYLERDAFSRKPEPVLSGVD